MSAAKREKIGVGSLLRHGNIDLLRNYDNDDKMDDEKVIDGKTYKEVPVESIVVNPENCRLSFKEEELEELAASIKSVGLQNPLVVVADKEDGDKYILVSGERRFRALKLLDIKLIPVLVLVDDNIDDQGIYLRMMIENLQRKDLTERERAEGVIRLRTNYGLNNTEIAQELGYTKARITQLSNVLKLPEHMLDRLEKLGLKNSRYYTILYRAKKISVRYMEELFEKVEEGATIKELSSILKARIEGKKKKPLGQSRKYFQNELKRINKNWTKYSLKRKEEIIHDLREYANSILRESNKLEDVLGEKNES